MHLVTDLTERIGWTNLKGDHDDHMTRNGPGGTDGDHGDRYDGHPVDRYGYRGIVCPNGCASVDRCRARLTSECPCSDRVLCVIVAVVARLQCCGFRLQV